MSFILDALKKSEAERQRQAGPTLLELRITRPRRRYPLWSLLVGALLAVNAAVLLTFLLRRPVTAPAGSTPSSVVASPAPVAAAATAAAPAATAPKGAAPAAAASSTAGANTSGGTASTSSRAQVPALVAQPGQGPATRGGSTLITPDGASSAVSAQARRQPEGQPATQEPAEGPAQRPRQEQDVAAEVSGSAARNPADYEPALPAGSQPQLQSPSQAARASQPAAQATQSGSVDYSSLPSVSQIDGNIPSMQLDLLDYSELSSERYALINMHRVREGDTLPDGAKVLAITPDGVAMDYRGQQFLLRPGGTAQ